MLENPEIAQIKGGNVKYILLDFVVINDSIKAVLKDTSGKIRIEDYNKIIINKK